MIRAFYFFASLALASQVRAREWSGHGIGERFVFWLMTDAALFVRVAAVLLDSNQRQTLTDNCCSTPSLPRALSLVPSLSCPLDPPRNPKTCLPLKNTQAASSEISGGLNVNATVSRARVALNKAASAVPSAVETLVNAAVNENPAKAVDEAKARLGPGFGAWKGKNVVIFITDQESPLLNVPPGWEEANLPGLTRLKKNGLEFKRAYTNAAMCTSARATFFTGFLTTQSNARYVLEPFRVRVRV